MRRALFLLANAALVLASCADADGDAAGSQSTGPDGELAGTPTPAADPPGMVRLRGDGILVTGPLGTSLAFNSPRAAVEAELVKSLGPALERERNEECGAGPMEFTDFPGGLTLNFQDGKLVGWFLDDTNGSAASGEIATEAGVTVGSPEGALAASLSIEMQEGSTLGEEFYSESGIGGFLSGEADAKVVESLYAGTNCFFR